MNGLFELVAQEAPAKITPILAILAVFLVIAGVGALFEAAGLAPKWHFFKSHGNSYIVAALGVLLLGPGLTLCWYLFFTHKVFVLTSLTEEEYAEFEKVKAKFNEHYRQEFPRVVIWSENVDPERLVQRLRQETVDVTILDISRRLDVVRECLVRPVDDLSRFIPSSVNPALLDELSVDGRRYFLPYRPNVRIAWWNELELAEALPPEFPATWQALSCFADRTARETPWGRRAPFLLSGKGAEEGQSLDAALLLLELIYASDCDPRDLCAAWRGQCGRGVEGIGPLQLLQALWALADPVSAHTDAFTASGRLLSGHVHFGRNWSFSISTMRKARELWRFHPTQGWAFGVGERGAKAPVKTLLGGDVVAIPQSARHLGRSKEVVSFLLSEKAQRTLVNGLSWPPMRFDSYSAAQSGDSPPEPDASRVPDLLAPVLKDFVGRWDALRLRQDAAQAERTASHVPQGLSKQHPELTECQGDDGPVREECKEKLAGVHLDLAQESVRQAIRYAKPTPSYWSREMHQTYLTVFRALVDPDHASAGQAVSCGEGGDGHGGSASTPPSALSGGGAVPPWFIAAAGPYCDGRDRGGATTFCGPDTSSTDCDIRLQVAMVPSPEDGAWNERRVRVQLMAAGSRGRSASEVQTGTEPTSFPGDLCVGLNYADGGTERVKILAGHAWGQSELNLFPAPRLLGIRALESLTVVERAAGEESNKAWCVGALHGVRPSPMLGATIPLATCMWAVLLLPVDLVALGLLLACAFSLWRKGNDSMLCKAPLFSLGVVLLGLPILLMVFLRVTAVVDFVQELWSWSRRFDKLWIGAFFLAVGCFGYLALRAIFLRNGARMGRTAAKTGERPRLFPTSKFSRQRRRSWRRHPGSRRGKARG